MKLLLTSAGLTNRSIAAALTELVGKSPYDTKIGLIPTAKNVESSRRGSHVGQFLNLWQHGFDFIDVIDPSAADVDWRKRLAEVDVIYVAGGNTFHLLKQARETGLSDWLDKNKDSKTYLGVSAGTILATPTIEIANMPPGDDNLAALKDLTGLKWVNFEIEPHCDKDRFATVEAYASSKKYPVYAIDDQTAIKVVDDTVEVISQGSWQVFGPQ